MAELRFESDGNAQVVAITSYVTIGRDPANILALASDAAVSRDHARLAWSGAALELHDLDSRNGTFIERAGRTIRVTSAMLLADGDVIRIGGTRFTLLGPELATSASDEGDDPGATMVGRILPTPRD